MMRPADARAAADAGADAIGMILHANAKRKIDHDTAAAIVAVLPAYVTAVGVFVDAPPQVVKQTAAALSLNTVQLHGNETIDDVAACSPLKVIKAIKVDPQAIGVMLDDWREAYQTGRCPNLVALLLETPVAGAAGGTGVVNDFPFIRRLLYEGAFDGLPPIVVSGGLTPDNVGEVVRLLHPYAVDVSSGIEETFGEKSIAKMRTFVETTHAAS